jgi:hypothetical protein
MDFTESRNTFFAVPKDDAKDRIQVEIGDSKQDDFYPQVKVMRWDNECNLSIRLVTEEDVKVAAQSVDSKVQWVGAGISAEFYQINKQAEDGGIEFEVILKEPQKSNVIQFSIQPKGLEFFKTPELTASDILRGDRQSPEAIGSIAVYHKDCPLNFAGGKLYRNGKMGWIPRPQMVDANGKKCWNELDIDVEAGLLTVTMPQDFLDNASYPIRHAAGLTFGYTTHGTGGETIVTKDTSLIGSIFTSPSNVGAIQNLIVYTEGYGNFTAKGIISLYNGGAGSLVTNGVSSATACGSGNAENTFDFGTDPTLSPSTVYHLGMMCTSYNALLYYDAGTGLGPRDDANVYATPINPTFGTPQDRKHSIWATYTAGGATPIPVFMNQYRQRQA